MSDELYTPLDAQDAEEGFQGNHRQLSMKGQHVGQATRTKAGSGETPRIQGWKEGRMRWGGVDRRTESLGIYREVSEVDAKYQNLHGLGSTVWTVS